MGAQVPYKKMACIMGAVVLSAVPAIGAAEERVQDHPKEHSKTQLKKY